MASPVGHNQMVVPLSSVYQSEAGLWFSRTCLQEGAWFPWENPASKLCQQMDCNHKQMHYHDIDGLL